MPDSSNAHPIPARVSPWLSGLLYPLSHLVLPTYFGSVEVIGRENVPQTGPLIVAPTHRSRWDALIVPYAVGRASTGRDLNFMVSANEIAGLQGWFIRNMGGFPVDPEHPGTSSIRQSVELLCHDRALVIFPEGNIFRERDVQPLKPGPGRIALQAQSHHTGETVKVLPVAIAYSQSVPSWGTDVRVTIGKAINTGDYRNGPARREAPRLMGDLETALRDLSGRSLAAAS